MDVERKVGLIAYGESIPDRFVNTESGCRKENRSTGPVKSKLNEPGKRQTARRSTLGSDIVQVSSRWGRFYVKGLLGVLPT